MPISLSAVVLAAGRSTRMGSDKALLEHEGRPMWQRQRDIVAAAGASEIFLSARPEQTWANGAAGFAAVVHDAQPDCGPIVGVTAAVERMSHPHLAVVAIDLPRLPAVWFLQLAAECLPAVGVVGRHEGIFEPLAAIYPRELKWLAWETIVAGDYSLQRMLAKATAAGLMRIHEISASEREWFENRNAPPP